MAISPMYPAKAGSPKTALTADITASAISMTVEDASVLPVPPNLCVIGADENAEIVSYTTITGNTVSGLIRGVGTTTAKSWTAETDVARNYTSFDHDRFIENIQTLDSEKAPKANPEFSGTPKAPTASSGDNSTQIATTAFVQTAVSGKANASHTHSASDITSGTLGTANGGTGNSTGTAPLAKTTADTSNALYPVGVTSGATTTLKRDTSVTIQGGTVTAATFSGALSGNASTATALATGRTIRTNLASTTAVSFDGTSNVAPGVTGTLPVANGGTGATTEHGAVASLFADNVGASATYFLTRTNSWQACGYSSLAQVKSMMGLDDSGEQTFETDKLSSGAIYYRKIGNVVCIGGTFALNANLTTTNILLGFLGSAYLPKRDIWCWCGTPATAGAEAGSLVIRSTGNVQFYKPASLSTWTTALSAHFSATYFTA